MDFSIDDVPFVFPFGAASQLASWPYRYDSLLYKIKQREKKISQSKEKKPELSTERETIFRRYIFLKKSNVWKKYTVGQFKKNSFV